MSSPSWRPSAGHNCATVKPLWLDWPLSWPRPSPHLLHLGALRARQRVPSAGGWTTRSGEARPSDSAAHQRTSYLISNPGAWAIGAPGRIFFQKARGGETDRSETFELSDLQSGRAAYERGAWMDAFKALSLADRPRPLGAPDLCSLAWSAYLIGRHDDFLRAMERAHQAYASATEVRDAARCAFWLGFVLGHRGEIGPASGWLERAGRLLAGDGTDCVELGYLLLPELMMQAMAGEWDAVHGVAVDAAAIGQRFAEPDLTAFSLHWRGRALVRMRRSKEGFALLDESMVSVTAGELSPLITGLLYCSMIEACQEVYALRRSREWTHALSAWCNGQTDLVPFTGQCLVHRAELMVLNGAWQDAVNEVQRAYGLASQGGDQPAVGAALYQLGEIHRLRGEFDAAVDAYQRASRSGREPQPGLSLLRLAQGDVAAATAAIRRVCDETNDPLERARLLPAFAQIMIAADRPEDARTACIELTEIADAFSSAVLAAIAASANAALCLRAGDARSALVALREAEQVWQRIESPYELARVRLMVGQACLALGDHDTAKLELDAARDIFRQLGAAPDLAHIGAVSFDTPPEVRLLTERELEVLRLVTSGKSNKAIAAELFVSEKTVERHASNIFTKLGVSSRAGATAYAYEHSLI